MILPCHLHVFEIGSSLAYTLEQDTVKTRLTTQSVADAGAAAVKYSGVINCFSLIIKEEGIGALYRALPPRLLSVNLLPFYCHLFDS